MGNGLSSDQGSFTPHGLRDVDKFGTEQRQHDWSNPEDDNMLAGAPNNEELNSLSTFNRHDGSEPTSHNDQNRCAQTLDRPKLWDATLEASY